MKVYNQLTLLILTLLLQSCLPDSFTKFKEEPTVKKEQGASGNNDLCPVGSTDPFCLLPTSIFYQDDLAFDINATTLNEDLLIEPAVIGGTFVEGFNQFATYSITPALPPGIGISFDVNTGIISGVPQLYYQGTHTVTVQYFGNTPATLTTAPLDISIATTLRPTASIQNPRDKTLVLRVSDATPFIGRTWVSAQGQNGSAQIQFLDLVSNEIHLNSNLVGGTGRFILRTQNELSIDNVATFASVKALSSSVVFALEPGDNLTVDQGVLSTAIYIQPLGEATTIGSTEFATLNFSITPSLQHGLIFTERTSCYDLNVATPVLVSNVFCDSAAPGYQLVPGGTIWGQISPGVEQIPTTYTIAASNIHGSEATRNVVISIADPAAPKSTSGIAYRQVATQNLKVKVSNASVFDGKTHVATSEGKVGIINGVDPTTNFLYLTVQATDGRFFRPGIALDYQNIFFTSRGTVTETPIFFYDDSPIDNQGGQPFITLEVSPLNIFEGSTPAIREQERALTFSITPNIQLVGLNFQTQSACYDVSSGDHSTFVVQPDFTDCDASVPGFSVIRGGTIWGQINDAYVPLPETTFTVTARSPNGRTISDTIKVEFTPFLEPAEFSLSQDLLVRLQTTTNFKVGDYISNSAGARGTVKEVFNANGSTFVWINVQQGNFVKNTNVDNKFPYVNQRGFISDLQPVNARIVTNTPIPVLDFMINQEDEDNIITSATGRARVVYKNGTTTFIRVNEGVFTTGESLRNEEGTLLAGPVTITNINAQNLRITLSAALPAGIGRDHGLVYAASDDGNSYIGTMHIRNITSSTVLDIEMSKGSIAVGDVNYLRLANPVTPAVASRTISSISTNHNRYIAWKGFGFKIVPFLETGANASIFEITPSLPPGLIFNTSTGDISGTPTDRADQTVYTISVSNDFENPTYQPKTYTITLEVKDYLALFNKTANAGSYILHKSGMGNGREPCMITRDQFESDDATQRDIACFLEAGELDLYLKGLDIDFSLGNDMCQFYRLDPYYFSRFPVPSTTDILNANLNPEIHSGSFNNPLCQNAASPTISVAANPDLATPAQVRCDYDYSTVLDWLGDGYNCDARTLAIRTRDYSLIDVCPSNPGFTYNAETCGSCVGDASLTDQASCVDDGRTWVPETPQPACRDTVISVTNHECGGEPESCMAGAGTEIGLKTDLFNLNTAVIENAEGLDKVNTKFSSPQSLNLFTNKHLANFKNVNTCTPTRYSYSYNTLELNFRNKKAAAKAAGQILTPFVGNPYYSYLCLDSANNVQARIRLIVREWNQSFRASDNIDMIDPDSVQAAVPSLDRRMDLYLDGGGDPIFNSFGEVVNRYLDWESDDIGAGACNVFDATGFPDGELDF